MWNKKSWIGYKNVFLQQIRDVEQQIHRQLGDGYDSIVNYACGNMLRLLSFQKVHKNCPQNLVVRKCFYWIKNLLSQF